MLSVRARALLLATLLSGLAACGGGGDDDREANLRPRGTTAATGATSSLGPPAGRPQVDVDFARGASDELPAFESTDGSGAQQDGSYRLRLFEGDAVRAPARRTATPGTAPVVVVGTVRAPTELDGRAGVFCRGSADGRTGYELSVDRVGRVRLERVRDGRRTLIAGYEARIDAASPPDAPLPLVLFCAGGPGTGAEATLGVVVGVKAMTFFADPEPLEPGPRAQAGLVVSGGGRATAAFAAFQLTVTRS